MVRQILAVKGIFAVDEMAEIFIVALKDAALKL